MYLPVYLQTVWWYKFPKIKNKSKITEFIRACKNVDGGYGNYMESTSYLENVFYAMVTLSLFNEMGEVKDDTIAYIRSAECTCGGFGEPGIDRPNIFNTFYAVVSLKKLDRIDCELRSSVLNYLQTIIADGKIDCGHIGMTNTTSVFWVVSILQSIGYFESGLRNWIVEFCMSCFNTEEYLFSSIPSGIPTIQNTYECLSILKQYSALDMLDLNRIEQAVLKLKKGGYYLDRVTGKYTISTTMWAMETLNILGEINEFEQYDVVNLAAHIFEEPNSVYDLFCATSILVCVFYHSGTVNLDVTEMLEEKGDSVVYKAMQDTLRKIIRSGYDVMRYDFVPLIKRNSNNMNICFRKFYQIKLNFENDSDAMYELEYAKELNNPYALLMPMTRVTNECIYGKVINARRISLLGIFDSKENLEYSRLEEKVLDDYCKDNNFFQFTAICGHNATKEKVLSCISARQHVFYLSSHCIDGSVQLADTCIPLENIIDILIESHCSIIILNCCDTYQYVKRYLKEKPYIDENVNILCTLNDVNDEQASYFITAFFYYMELSFPISEAVRLAKYETYLKNDGLGDTWLSYILFGNPYTLITA